MSLIPDRRHSRSPRSPKQSRPTSYPPDHEEEEPILVKEAGVARIEALYQVFGGTHGAPIWILYASIGLIAYVYSLDSNTTSQFLPFALSAFGAHSLLGTINVVNTIISAVAQPLLAKFADVTSRPRAYVLALSFYLMGYLIIATSRNVQAVTLGELFYTIGRTGLDLITEIIAADLSPLKWRGFATALPASPFIINAFVSAEIVQAILGTEGHDRWRWGYGIFIILMPIVMAPALMILFWAELKAAETQSVTISSSSWDRRVQDTGNTQTLWEVIRDFCIHIDALGLALLAFGYGLVLLPFTLYHKLKVEFNGDLIAMFVLGICLLVVFAIYEFKYAPMPLMAWRLFNQTFVCAIVIDLFYFMSGNLRSQYYASWVWVVKDWDHRQWTYFNHIVTVGLCIFGLMAGAILRYTHRYKWLQFSGLCIRLVGMGLTLHARGENATTFNLVATQILIALGGACSVVGSRVASQASVRHEDMASVIALLSLWTKMGGSLGYAASASIWNWQMPENMKKYLPNLSPKERDRLFGSIKDARVAPPEVRAGVINAYNDTAYYLYLPALLLSFVPIVAALFMKNYYLGESHNVVEVAEGESERAPSIRSSRAGSSRNSVLGEETPLLAPPEDPEPEQSPVPA